MAWFGGKKKSKKKQRKSKKVDRKSDDNQRKIETIRKSNRKNKWK